MKKVLSLVLSLALIIATMALPISASAASIDLAGLGTGTVSISYKAFSNAEGTGAEVTNVKAGDTIYVAAYIEYTKAAVAAEEEEVTSINVTEVEVPVKYDPAVLTYDASALSIESAFTNSKDSIVTTDTETGIIRYGATDLNAALDHATQTKMFTMKFTVTGGVVGNTSVITYENEVYEAAVVNSSDDYYAPSETNLSTTNLTLTLEANTAFAYINANEELQNKTYYDADGFTVTYGGTNITEAKITKTKEANGDAIVGATAVDIGEGYPVNAAGTYYVKVTAQGGVTKEYTFTLVLEAVSANLVSTLEDGDLTDAPGYREGNTFTVPVTITLNAGAKAAMVAFDVKYDKSSLTLNTTDTDLVKYEAIEGGYTVTYGTKTNETPLATGGTVATLAFTVAGTPTLGDKEITFYNAKLALAVDQIDPTAPTLGLPGTQTVTVVASTFATAAYATENQPWTNGRYNVTVAPADSSNVTVAYKAYESSDLTNVDTTTQSGLAAIYTGGTVTNTITFDSEKTYYAVAKIGSVYQLVTLPDNKIDLTEPTVNASAADMSAWKSGVTEYQLDVSGVTASDQEGKSGIASVTYTIGESTLTVTDNKITIPAGSYNGEVVTVTVTDNAGNSQTDTIKLMLDGVAPDVNVQIGEIDAQTNSRDLTITVTGLDGGSATSVALYKLNAAATSANDFTVTNKVKDLTVTEGEAKVENVTEAGFYYVYAIDEAGNKSYDGGEVTFNSINAASRIAVKVLKNSSDYIAKGFKTTTEMTGIGITDKSNATLDTNGSFTYVAIKVDAPITGYSNAITVKNNGSDTTITPGTDGEYVFDAEGVYEFVVKTTNNGNTEDSQSATYKFSVVAAASMPSINADMRYNVVDYAMIRKIVNAEGKVLPAAGDDYWGGLFSGDLTGDLQVTGVDLAAMLTSLKNGEKKGAYNSIPVMNYKAPSTGEQNTTE